MVIRRGLYSRRDLQEAVDRVIVDEEKGSYVSKTSSIPVRTLRKYVKRRRETGSRDVANVRRGPAPVLTSAQEQTIVQWIQTHDRPDVPSGPQIIEKANQLLKTSTVGVGWYGRFRLRHQQALEPFFTSKRKLKSKAESTPVSTPPATTSISSRSGCSSSRTDLSVVRMSSMGEQDAVVPIELQADYYFDRIAHPFEHETIFMGTNHVFEVLNRIHHYIVNWFALYPQKKDAMLVQLSSNGSHPNIPFFGQDPVQLVLESPLLFDRISFDKIIRKPMQNTDFSLSTIPQLIISGTACVAGGIFDLSKGSIYIGENVTIDPGVYIAGPVIVGSRCHIRFGAYIRGDVILGESVHVRAELKNVLILDNAQLCHPGYCGDSILGYGSHFGNQATSSNLSLLSAIPGNTIKIKLNNITYDTERTKLGLVLGDESQLGCNTVTDPGTLIGKNTHIYPLSRINKGIYGPNQLIKNKPMEHGIVKPTPFHSVCRM